LLEAVAVARVGHHMRDATTSHIHSTIAVDSSSGSRTQTQGSADSFRTVATQFPSKTCMGRWSQCGDNLLLTSMCNVNASVSKDSSN
jgi:hypothetical protein